jgi:hypothetical protein
LTAALGEWKNGTRKTDPSQQMNMIAKRLSDADIAAVAAYYSAQPAPPPAAQRTNIPARPSSQPRTQADSVPTQGIGTEQGAPTTGGGQGPGGGGGASGSGPSGSPAGTAK